LKMQAVRLLLLPHLLFLPLRRAPVPLRTARLFSRGQLHAGRRGPVAGMLDRVFNILSLGRGA
jgi:hypothetical protein